MIEIMQTFVRLRGMAATYEELARCLDEPEESYDGQFKVVFEAIRKMMVPPAPQPTVWIGFVRVGADQAEGQRG